MFTVLETNLDEMFHIFQVASQTDAVLQIPPDTVEFVGSFSYVHLVPNEGNGNARVNWGFHADISPVELAPVAQFFFEEFMDVIVSKMTTLSLGDYWLLVCRVNRYDDGNIVFSNRVGDCILRYLKDVTW